MGKIALDKCLCKSGLSSEESLKGGTTVYPGDDNDPHFVFYVRKQTGYQHLNGIKCNGLP